MGRGGAQQVFRQQMNSLGNVFDVIGCVFNWDGAFESDRSPNIISLNVSGGKNFLQKIRFFFLRIKRLKDLKRKEKIDVCISHLEGADYVNILSKSRDKTICWIHGTKRHDKNINGFIGLLRLKLLLPWLYRKSNKIVSVSRGIAEELSDKYRLPVMKLSTIYNGLDIESIAQKSEERIESIFLELFDGSPLVISHCRLARQKNLKAMLAIFCEMLSMVDKIKLVIIGDGEERGALLSFCEEKKLRYWAAWSASGIDLNANVFFFGQQNNPFKFLKKSSLFIMTSSWEGFPLALCEAITVGLPVIASDCFTGPREIISPDCTLIQPVNKPLAGQCGVLMPLAVVDNRETIQLWASEALNLINNTASNFKTRRGNCVDLFADSKSREQTINLVKEIC